MKTAREWAEEVTAMWGLRVEWPLLTEEYRQYVESIEALFAQAMQEQREWCAKVVEKCQAVVFTNEFSEVHGNGVATRANAAAAIRAMGK